MTQTRDWSLRNVLQVPRPTEGCTLEIVQREASERVAPASYGCGSILPNEACTLLNKTPLISTFRISRLSE